MTFEKDCDTNKIALNKMGQYLLTVLEGTKGGVQRRWISFSRVPLCYDLLHIYDHDSCAETKC